MQAYLCILLKFSVLTGLTLPNISTYISSHARPVETLHI
jgi:hypothetical protein